MKVAGPAGEWEEDVAADGEMGEGMLGGVAV